MSVPSVPLMVMVMFSVAMVPLHRDRFYPGRLTAQVNRVTVRTASPNSVAGYPFLSCVVMGVFRGRCATQDSLYRVARVAHSDYSRNLGPNQDYKYTKHID